MTTSMYCEAKHADSALGCYELTDHDGAHRGYRPYAQAPFYWSNETPTEQTDLSTLTQAEVGILLTCLQPVTQFFPELVKKLEGMQG